MLVDLSHTLVSGIMVVKSSPAAEICRVSNLADGANTNMMQIRISSHTGTHIDAPIHVIDGLRTIDQLGTDRFVGPGVALSLRKGPNETISAADLDAASSGRVRPGDMVLLHTGWDERFGQESYLTDYPNLTMDAADWLLDHQVRLVALDLLSPDLPPNRRAPDHGLPVHKRLLGNDILIAENLTGIGAVAGHRLTVYALPIKIGGGDGAPARITVEVAD
jgi:kynurenine formamidase